MLPELTQANLKLFVATPTFNFSHGGPQKGMCAATRTARRVCTHSSTAEQPGIPHSSRQQRRPQRTRARGAASGSGRECPPCSSMTLPSSTPLTTPSQPSPAPPGPTPELAAAAGRSAHSPGGSPAPPASARPWCTRLGASGQLQPWQPVQERAWGAGV